MERIKEEILDIFRRAKCRAGHMVPYRTIVFKFRQTQTEFMPALNALQDEGFIEFRDGTLPAFFLTTKGYDQIYKASTDNQLRRMVLDLFVRQRCSAGQGFMFRTLNTVIIGNLNPKDQDRILYVLDKMIDDKEIIVDFENNYPVFVKLTEIGYQSINKS